MCGLIAPTAYLSPARGRQYQPAGCSPVASFSTATVWRMRSRSSARSSVLTSSWHQPWAAISCPSACRERTISG
ncbi:hypothetical protein LUX39_52035 [Actinomadura madurae]|nr:hypothetical protein [Actinomadura madurae]MCQ0021149.1 hypothetical protein [Actinomadura madurae]